MRFKEFLLSEGMREEAADDIAATLKKMGFKVRKDEGKSPYTKKVELERVVGSKGKAEVQWYPFGMIFLKPKSNYDQNAIEDDPMIKKSTSNLEYVIFKLKNPLKDGPKFIKKYVKK